MDRIIENNAELFDGLIRALNRHRDEPGVAEAIAYLKAAKTNYIQRSIDHLVNCLTLVLYELVRQPPREGLRCDLSSVIQEYVKGIFEAGARMSQLAHQYEAGGGTLLSREEILRDVDERRGASRS
ncbi:MAG TPA: hypothetical protein VH640_18985 [Bryobacteraceae bacterium]